MSLTKATWRKNNLYKKAALIFVAVLLATSCGQPKKLGESKGSVVSAHPLASAIGAEVLRNGGNAFDAAVAMHFALSVVYPVAGNIGGGGFAVYRMADGYTKSIDFRETAPLAASKDMYVDAQGKAHPEQTRLGILSAGVPGSVAGMELLHKQGGSLPWKTLVDPSVAIAAKGFSLTEDGAYELRKIQHTLDSLNPFHHPFKAPHGEWKATDTLVQADLAHTLQLIADSGAAAFYSGSVATSIVNDVQERGGLITADDLKNYAAIERAALHVKYKDYVVHTMAPPSSGGVALAQLLRGSSSFDWRKAGFQTPSAVHHMVELMRRAYAQRAKYGGDPDFVMVPVQLLCDSVYNTMVFADIDSTRATPSASLQPGNVSRIESFQTTHYSVVDQWGNAVSVTTTLNNYFGSGIWVRGAGFFLNNEMDDFSIQPGVPNQFGLVGGEANAIAPGKRMLSSMTPTIVEQNGELRYVLGTPGGSTIITNVYQVLMNCTEYKMTLNDAIRMKKIHAQWLPDVVYLEDSLSSNAPLLEGLVSRGHVCEGIPRIGRFCGIEVDIATGKTTACGDAQRLIDITPIDIGVSP